MTDLYLNDLRYREAWKLVCGVDEAGRGPLAGPVVVAAVILNYDIRIDKLNDSKQVSPAQRELLFERIISTAFKYSIVEIDAAQIDEMNILQATLAGMRQAIEAIEEPEALYLIDGNKSPYAVLEHSFKELDNGSLNPVLSENKMVYSALNSNKNNCLPVIKGDALHACIAAASILAKVHRDRIMLSLHDRYPQYGFDRNKGYPSPAHLKAINTHGICPIHRMSYAPVQQRYIWELTNL